MPYEVVNSYRDTETFGNNDSRPIQRVTVRSIPSGVSYSVQFTANDATFNDPDALARATAAIAEPYAEYVEAALAMPGVAGVYSYDDFTPSNTVAGRWVVTITSTDGQLTTQADIPFIDIRPERLPAIVQKFTAGLDAIQASGQ